MDEAGPIGFIGLGLMGEPMAANLLKAGVRLVVWNRSLPKLAVLARAGAAPVDKPARVFERCGTVIMMLRNASAMDEALARDTSEFSYRIGGRLVISMATTEPGYSKKLGEDIRAAGGRYVEAPVSGSRRPAEDGQLAAMLAGDAADVSEAARIIGPMCKSAIACGPVPNALYMKLAVNLFMISMVTGLVEATQFAQRHGLDMETFSGVLNSSPMANDVMRVKLAKLLALDFAAQASIANVLENVRLIVDAGRDAAVASPIIGVCSELYGEAQEQGLGDEDMVAVLRAIERRTAAVRN